MKQQSVGTIISPRENSVGVTRSDNHGLRKQYIQSRPTLPDIVKKGPINNKNNTKKVVGLSLQRRDETPPKFTRKRGSIENTTKSHRNSKARNAMLKQLDQPKVKDKPTSTAVKKVPKVPTYRMPDRTASVPPRAPTLGVDSSRGSLSPIRKNNALKPLINNKTWIPGGHANSMGRNKLASVGKQINLMYHDTIRLAPEASVSRLSHHAV